MDRLSLSHGFPSRDGAFLNCLGQLVVTRRGSSIAVAMEILTKLGVATEVDVPYPQGSVLDAYDDSLFGLFFRYGLRLPAGKTFDVEAGHAFERAFAEEALTQAATGMTSHEPGRLRFPAKIKESSRIRLASIEPLKSLPAIRSSLSRGQPVVLGVEVYESFYGEAVARGGLVPVPRIGQEAHLGGHAVLAVGYDDRRRQLILRNSWGPKWGDRGYFYLPYAFAQAGLLRDAWSGSL